MSPLADLQADLGARLLAGAGPMDPGGDTPAERAGWPVTRALYRQGRASRIATLAPLTLAALGEHAELTVDAYLAANPGAMPDTTDFLRFAAAVRPDDPWLAETTFLELALLRAGLPDSAERRPAPGCLGRGCRASLRTVPFPPARLIAWLSGRGDRPNGIPGGMRILVAPAVPGRIRTATAGEARIWHWLAMDRPVSAATGERAGPVVTLVRAGAVRQTAAATTPRRPSTSGV